MTRKTSTSLTKRLVPWCGTVRQPPRADAIAEYVNDAGHVVAWAWTFSDEKNLIERDDAATERRLQARGLEVST